MVDLFPCCVDVRVPSQLQAQARHHRRALPFSVQVCLCGTSPSPARMYRRYAKARFAMDIKAALAIAIAIAIALFVRLGGLLTLN